MLNEKSNERDEIIMHLELDMGSPNTNKITAFNDGMIRVNNIDYNASLIVMPAKVIEDWPIININQLTDVHIAKLLMLNP